MTRALQKGTTVPLAGEPRRGVSPAGRSRARARTCAREGAYARARIRAGARVHVRERATPASPPSARSRQSLACRLIAALVVWLSLALTPASAGEELIGLTFSHRSVETLLVHKHQGRLWLPIDDVADALSLKPVSDDPKSRSVTLATPLGPIVVPPEAMIHRNATRYLDQRFLETRLNGKTAFDADSGILAVDLPWRPGARVVIKDNSEAAPKLRPEVYPDTAGLATIHGDLAYTVDANARNAFEGVLRATGYAYGGVWQVTYEEDLLARHDIRDAIWMKQIDENRFVQIGHQTIALHPLLDAIELTGVQFAWTNVPARRQSPGLDAGALLERRIDHARSFSGTGPVGGRAELWLDDHLYASQPITIAATYSFDDIPLPARRTRIEIRIYDRRDAKTPVNIEKKTLSLSELLMEREQFAVLVGAGYGGNVFEVATDQLRGGHRPHTRYRDDQGTAAFALGRYGVNDDLTVEAGVTLTGKTPRATAGAIARLTPGAVGSAAVAYGEETGLSTLAQVDWRKTDWQVVARSYWRERDYHASFRPTITSSGRRIYDPDWDHFLEIAYAARANLTAGLIARHQPEASFVLPFARWQPVKNFTIQARPDQYGTYRIDSRYALSRRAHVYASYHDGDASVSYVRSLDDDLTVTAEVQRSWRSIWRTGLRLSAPRLLEYDVAWNLGGYISDDGGYDLYAGLRRQVRPGVYVYTDGHYASYDGGFYRYDDREDMRVRVGVAFDLAMTKDGLAAAPSYGIDRNHGAIAGRVRAPAGSGATDLSGLAVEVDDRRVATTEADGTFFAANVDVGTRLVTVDGENLPIELIAKRTRVVAEVAPGAVTTLDFELAAEYGAAGRVIDAAGRPVTGIEVLITDAAGKEVTRVDVNDFGYYRADGLAPGDYQAHALTGERRGPATAFRISNAFIFDVVVRR